MAAKSILLVEDNPDDELLVTREIRKHNVVNEITVARDGAEALDYLFCEGSFSDRSPDTDPALVILDLKLPKIDGLEVLKRIKSHKDTRFLPVVIMTSSDEEQDVLDSYKFGASGYVRKPVDFKEFREAVKNLQMYWILTNEPPPIR